MSLMVENGAEEVNWLFIQQKCCSKDLGVEDAAVLTKTQLNAWRWLMDGPCGPHRPC